MSIQTQSILISSEEIQKFYEEKFYFSYSSINKLLFSPRLFYTHYILKQREDSVDAHLVAGRATHCLLLEPERFDEQFIMLPGKIPTDSNRSLLDHIYNTYYLSMNNSALELEDFGNEILTYLLSVNLYQSLKTDAQRIEKILTDNNKEYFNFLKVKENKTVIDSAVKTQAEEVVGVIKADDRVKALLQIGTGGAESMSCLNELMLKTDLEKHDYGFKGIVDNLVIEESSRTIFINDLKLTSKLIQDFPKTVDYYRYDIQAMMYIGLTVNNFIRHRPDAEYWKVVFTFIVVDKYNQIYPYQVSEQTLKVWENNFKSVLEILDYHYKSRDYTLPYELALGNLKL